MRIRRITAIVPLEIVEPLEEHLRICGVPGVTVEHVKGYGEHPNFFRRDLLHKNARLQLYLEDDEVDDVVAAIEKCATENGARAGVLVVDRIDRLVRLGGGESPPPT